MTKGNFVHDDDMLNQIRALWADNLSAGEIAAKVGGMTRNAVIGVVCRRRAIEGSGAWPVRQGSNQHLRPAKRRSKPKPKPKPPRKAAKRPQTAEGPKKPQPLPKPERPLSEPIRWLGRDIAHQCSYIADDPLAGPVGDLTCCGAPVEFGYSWCAYHREIVFPRAEQTRRSRGAVVG